MKRKSWCAILALLAAVFFLSVVPGAKRERKLDPALNPAPAEPESRTVAPAAAAPAAIVKDGAPTARFKPLPRQAALWNRPVSEPPFAAFAEWTRRYVQAPTVEAKAALEAEGVALARARLSALADLMEADPKRVLELAVPYAVREAMPDSIGALLEEQVNTRGDYQVLGVLPAGMTDLPPVIRSATIDDEVYEVFTYGDGLAYVTKAGVPMNGIAVPANVGKVPRGNSLLRPSKVMALSPSPARLLDESEMEDLRAKRQADPLCPDSGDPVTSRGAETAIEFAGVIESFCGQVHAEDWAAAGMAASGLEVPSGAASFPTAESSYTEGRKRMLLMRPIWSDYTGGMSDTNAALTHWRNFSNYMAEMSYDKLLLAPLGQGSDITPNMLLPGLVAEYDDTGLGKLYNTCRDVARTNYGYDLSQYDFLYVCTGSRPAASYAGLAYVGGVGFHLANGYFDPAVSSHEFGHNLGLNHAHFWDTQARSIIGSGQNVEYGDGNDPMGGGGSPNAFNSRYKNYLGWIRDADIGDLNASGSGRYRLYAFDLDASVGLRGLKFRRDGSQNYWVHFRQRKPDKALQNGVQLLWTGNGNQGSYLLDVRLRGGSSDNALVIGRTFSDPSLGFHITPVGKGRTYPESMDLQVNVGTFPANIPPTVAVSASTLNASPGQTVAFAATASDANGDVLAYYWEFGDGDYSVDNSSTAARSFSSAGEYAVQCTASDMKGGTARHTVIVRVGTPNTFRIGGHVLDRQNRPLAGIRVSTSAGQSVFTDSDGSYTLVGLPAGSYSLDAVEPVAGAMSFAKPFFSNPVTVGPNFTRADFVGVVGSLDIYTPLLAKAASNWRYLDNGTDQGTAWRAPVFSDASWSTGVAPLGYPSGSPISTVIGFGPDTDNKFITTYFRRQFVVPDPAAYTNLLLETLRDDGVAVYLNGTEVFRNNLPAGTLTSTTRAVDGVEPDSYLQTTLPTSLLVPGTNTLAAEIHQVLPSSSDIAFDAAVSGLSVSNASGFNLVYISSPADHARMAPPANMTINATALSGGAPAALVEFYANGLKLGEDSVSPFSFVWNSPANGTYRLTVVATIDGTRITSPPIEVTVAEPVPPGVALALVPPGAMWKYLANGAAPPLAWASPGYNDSAWPGGPAQLGYGDGDEATVVPFGGVSGNKWITTYFRRAFTVIDPGAISNLAVRLLRDDGGIVYLNGVEVFRSNLADGPVNHLTLAVNASDDGATFFGASVDPALLAPGTNVVAVEIHQDSAASSDISFNLGLDALGSAARPRGVYLTAPADGATVPLPGGAVLSAQVVAGGTLGVAKVEFFADGVEVGEATTVPFSFIWSSPPGGAHVLTAVATDTAGGAITSAPVNITVSAPPLGTALVSFGELWKYRDDGSDLGSAWTARSFNDGSWMAGPAKLGYGGDGERTVVSYGTNAGSKFITTYFRKAFTVTSPTPFHGLFLRLIRDDGAVVYLNGVQIYRDNLQAGPVSWNSLALAGVDGAGETTPVDVLLGTTGLLAGTNVLAVEIHQASLGSSDLGFDLALVGLKNTNTAQGIYLTSPAQGARFNASTAVGLSAYVVAPEPVTLVEYFAGGVKITEATIAPYAATWNNAPLGEHLLTARVTYGAGAMMTSGVASIVVGTPAAPIAPVFSTVISPGSTWRYWDSATAVGNGWPGAAFDDSAWPNASARFGWGLDGEMTPLTEGRISHYFRRWFTVADAAVLSELVLALVRDDGAVVYLNGVEVFRSNMPAGPITAATLASVTVNTPDETTWFETALATAGSGLLGGSNLIAVELHQSSAASSDGSFDFALYGRGTTEERIYLSAPANGSSVVAFTPLAVEVFARAGTGLSVSQVELFLDGIKQAEQSAPPFRFTLGGLDFGPHVLTARLTDSAGATRDSTPVNITVTRELISTVFIPANSVWKYLDTGANLGTSWAQASFNDSAWPSGPARLGFGDGGEATVLRGQPVNTYYFRRSFVPPTGVVYTNLSFGLARDDGAVVWLNGREVFRSNMPAGAIGFGTRASSAAGGADEYTFFPSLVTVTNLPAGTNVVAVEVHQASSDSSDVGFNLELVARGYVEDATPPALDIVFADGFVELSWPATATGWSVYTAASPDQPGSLWAPFSATVFVVNGRNRVALAPGASAQFFRLGKP